MRLTFSLIVAVAAVAPVAADSSRDQGSNSNPRSGANHRLGDDSFVAKFGRAPDRGDTERVRMKTHLEFVRAELAKQPATKPELEQKRSELLGYLDDYIAKGITPENTRLPWRTPVFIDDFGNICAVGYLIERSIGRDVPEQIAAKYRYEFLEDIAAAMPEVRAWIDASGFTLAELASIQPGYQQPQIEDWGRWTLADFADGAYHDARENAETTGTIVRGKMHGTWKRVDAKGRVIGKGKMERGRGTWHSFYPSGREMAVGPFAGNHPHGQWTFFHPSGRVAAVGAFHRGHRHGSWKFFYDDKQQTPIAAGKFHHGSITGTWKHFDREGELLARSEFVDTPHQTWEPGYLLTVTRGKDGIGRETHRLGGPDSHRLDGYYLGDDKLYVHNDRIYDANGFLLTIEPKAGWIATDCQWSKKRKRIAKAGDITTLHGLIASSRWDAVENVCTGDSHKITGERRDRINKLHDAMTAVRAPSPDFVKKLALGEKVIPEIEGETNYDNYVDDSMKDTAEDLPRLLAAHMSWYIEWPHIDGRFVEVFYTLPGHSRDWNPLLEQM